MVTMDRNRGFDIGALRQQIEELLDDFTGGSRRQQGGRGNVSDQPQHLALNVVDSEDRIVVSAPLPGLTPEDIDITVRGQTLALRAAQKTPSERPQYLRREWGNGPFHRTIELPSPVEADSAEASFRNGVVTITLPKSDPSKARVINLQEDAQPASQSPTEPAGEPIAEEPVDKTVPVAEAVQAPEAEAPAGGESAAPAEAAAPAEGTTEEPPASFYMRPPRRRGGESRAAREAARRAAAKEKAAAEKAAAAEAPTVEAPSEAAVAATPVEAAPPEQAVDTPAAKTESQDAE